MGFDAWFTLAVVAVTIAILVTERFPPAATMLGAVIVLFVFRVVDIGAAFGGFANPAPITVGALYILAGAAEATGALDALGTVLGRRRSERAALAGITAGAAGASAVVNNTPLVAVLVPQISNWAHRLGRSPSKYLMPLSFASILGGMITAIGTSTNLVVSGLLTDVGMAPIGMFEITRIGLPLAVVGVGLLVLVAPVLIKRRSGSSEHLREESREYIVEMTVTGNSIATKTVEEAGLRHLQGVFLVQIERRSRDIAPVGPNEVIHEGDRLMFAGNAERILDLQRFRGLKSSEEHHFGVAGSSRSFFEAVIGTNSPLAGSTLRETGFRSAYGGAVVALHRGGMRVQQKLGSVRLRPGDVLLVLADSDFEQRWRNRHDFLLVAEVGGSAPVRNSKAPLVGLIALALVVTSAVGLLSIVEAALIAAVALVVTGCATFTEARRSIDVEILILIASAFGVGAAVSESGLAGELGNLLVDGFGRFGTIALLGAIVIATLVLTELITNNAAAVLMFPIALAAADQFGLDPRGLAIAVAISASASFLSPIGYQTNTMVYGVGGYRFTDFARLGWIFTALTIAAIVVIVPIAWPLQP